MEPDPRLDITLDVATSAWTDALGDVEPWATRVLEAAAQRLPPPVDQAQIGLLFTDDDEMRELNARFRSKDAPTDVLSFEGDGAVADVAQGRPFFLGDIVLAFGVASRDASDAGKSLADHGAHLLVHGYCHLMGYDHAEERAAEIMEHVEREILAALGVRDPYQEDVAA